MQRHNHTIWTAAAAALVFALAMLVPAGPVTAVGTHQSSAHQADTFSIDEIVAAGHTFFGTTTKGVAQAIEFAFSRAGRPSGYIVGEELSGAFIGGLRYGEGVLHLKNGTSRKVYWQGPSVGLDWGGNGSRSMVLVYDISSAEEIFDRFIGVEGSAYMVAGIGVNFQKNHKLKLAPIRTGVGARFGANMGYVKYTGQPTWNPF
ncbi:MAG: DUF1134 domain-containing protein [Hyphomicrobiales bacterium]